MADSQDIKRLHPNTKNISGKRFGHLVVLGVSHSRKCPNYKGTVLYWKCLCDCGNEIAIPAPSLNSGDAKSCGCYQKQRTSEASITHGLRRSSEYAIWNTMKQRCENPSNPAYKNYGGRGIDVCESWRNSFERFYSDMGSRPIGLTIERINNDGNYEPANCKWATYKEQAGNKRNTKCRAS